MDIAGLGKQIRSWWIVSDGVFLTLSVGWSCVLVSMYFNFHISSSGAVLVCVALVSEAILMRRTLQDRYGSFLGSPSYDDEAKIEAMAVIFNPKKEGIVTAGAHNKASFVGLRVERTIFYCVVVTAAAGTLLWGYGDLFIPVILQTWGSIS